MTPALELTLQSFLPSLYDFFCVLPSAQSEGLDNALWSAFRALEENASLACELAERAKKHRREISARVFQERAEAVGGGYPPGVAKWTKQRDYR